MTALADLPEVDRAAYRALLRTPHLSTAELAARLGVEDAEDVLVRLGRAGLLRRTRAGWRPVRPDRVLGARLEQAEAEVEERRRGLVDARHELTALVEDYLAGRERGGGDVEVEVLQGITAIRERIDQLMAGTRSELLTFSSDLTEVDAEGIESWRAHDMPLLARGVVSRSIQPPEIRRHPLLWAYAEETWRAGEQIRMADRLPPRMVVRDREVAVLPLDVDDPRAGVLVVWSASLVVSLVRLFDEVWERARPAFGPAAPAHGHDPRLLSLLAAGAKDETVARQLGKGLRTVRREVAALLDDLGAATRFQAGMEAARRGWL